MRSCPRCSSVNLVRDGHDQRGGAVYACAGCARHATTESLSLASGHRFPRDIILLAVRYYLQLGAAAERIAGLLADRDVDVSGRTILRWVQRSVRAGPGGRSPATPSKGDDDVVGGRDLRQDPGQVALPLSGY